MWPKEHGAYAQLAIPIVTALAAGRPSRASFALTAAAVAAFVAHEPLAILIGVRGSRAKREEASRAWRWVALVGALGLSAGVSGLLVSQRARPFAIVALAFAAAAGVVLYRRKERTSLGQIVAAIALTGAAAPVGAASGLSTLAILACWGTWIAQSVLATFAVHAIVAPPQRRHAWPTLVATGCALVGAAFIGWPVALALVPTGIVCVSLVLSTLSAKSIRAAGLALTIAMILSAVSLALGYAA